MHSKDLGDDESMNVWINVTGPTVKMPYFSTLPFFTTHAEFNGESFKACRMLIFYLEVDIFIVM